MTRKSVEETRCASRENCAAYPALGEPSKLSRGNPGPRCFACEERRAASQLKATVPEEQVDQERGKAKEPRLSKSNRLEKHAGVSRAYEVLERRRRSVLTCKRGLHSALGARDERLVEKWSSSLRDAEERLAWAEEDLARAEATARSEHARAHYIAEAGSALEEMG